MAVRHCSTTHEGDLSTICFQSRDTVAVRVLGIHGSYILLLCLCRLLSKSVKLTTDTDIEVLTVNLQFGGSCCGSCSGVPDV